MAKDGRIVLFETIGDAEPGSRYTIFSMTKGIVGGAVWLLVGEGKLGRKSGAGFYDWHGRTPAEWFEDRDRRLIELKRAMRRVGSLAGLQEPGEGA